MRHRGGEYWAWADCLLNSWTHDEMMSDGTQIDVQTRLSRKAETQLFIGGYTKEGRMLFEEFYPALDSMTMAHALVMGVDRARALATGTHVSDRILPSLMLAPPLSDCEAKSR